MQKVFFWSSVTYEWSQVTPSSPLRSTTCRHTAAPSALTGIWRPSVNVLSTRYLGMCVPSFDEFRDLAMGETLGLGEAAGIGRSPQIGPGNHPCCGLDRGRDWAQDGDADGSIDG